MQTKISFSTVEILECCAIAVAFGVGLQLFVPASAGAQVVGEPTMAYDLMKKFSGPYPDGYTADQFTFDIVGTSASGTAVSMLDIELTEYTDDTATAVVQLSKGTYTITENGPAGFEPSEWVVQWSDAKGCEQQTGPSTEIVIDDSNFGLGNVGCRADNQWFPPVEPEPEPGVLIVEKIVINDDTGTSTADDFSFSIDGGASVDFEADGSNVFLDMATGTYSIVEDPLPVGYTVSYNNCTGVTVSAGATTTCTITNNDVDSGGGGYSQGSYGGGSYSQGSYGGGGYSQGSYSSGGGGGGGNGRNISLRDNDGNDGDNDSDDGPTPQVLGESNSALPAGAPGTGKGGASPLESNGSMAVMTHRSGINPQRRKLGFI